MVAGLNVIDISSAQAGLNFTSLSPAPDGVIVKATQGSTYKDGYMDAWVNTAQAENLVLGLYHYIDGSGAKAEADFFYNAVINYSGQFIPFVDWEEQENSAYSSGTAYLQDFINEFYEQYGVQPVIYSNVLNFREQDFSTKITTFNEVWYAQYLDSPPTTWTDTPWNDGIGVAPYKGNIIGQQYTDKLQIGQNVSTGGIDGSLFTMNSDGTKTKDQLISMWNARALLTGTPNPTGNNSSGAGQQANDPCSGLGTGGLIAWLYSGRNVKTLRR